MRLNAAAAPGAVFCIFIDRGSIVRASPPATQSASDGPTVVWFLPGNRSGVPNDPPRTHPGRERAPIDPRVAGGSFPHPGTTRSPTARWMPARCDLPSRRWPPAMKSLISRRHPPSTSLPPSAGPRRIPIGQATEALGQGRTTLRPGRLLAPKESQTGAGTPLLASIPPARVSPTLVTLMADSARAAPNNASFSRANSHKVSSAKSSSTKASSSKASSSKASADKASSAKGGSAKGGSAKVARPNGQAARPRAARARPARPRAARPRVTRAMAARPRVARARVARARAARARAARLRAARARAARARVARARVVLARAAEADLTPHCQSLHSPCRGRNLPMAQYLSADLRIRVIGAVEAGMSPGNQRQAIQMKILGKFRRLNQCVNPPASSLTI